MAGSGKTFNLFVYGTFMDRRLFRWVTGHDYTLDEQADEKTHLLRGRKGILASHQKISPDGMYFYAIPRKRHRISGYLIYNLPTELLELLDHYEGKRYHRTKVTVHQDAHRIRAYIYLANEKALRQDFGDRFRVNLKHEHVITKRVEEFLEQRTADSGDSEVPAHHRVLAEEELRGLTIRDLVRARLESSTVADYFLKRELSQPLPSVAELLKQPEAQCFINNYLSLLVRQVLFNQTEEKFREQFRFDLDHMGQSLRFYERTLSSVAALRMLNDRNKHVEKLVGQLVRDFDTRRHDLLDIVSWAIHAVESLYDARLANSVFGWLRENLNGGLLPLGVELEFSNVGHAIVADYDTGPGTRDEVFDGFRYFRDFALPALTWKLGGHLDDHQAHDTKDCLRGFLEFSPGASSIESKLSVPATKNPWLLGQLIRQMVRFYPVKPHSLHLSIQLLRRHIERKGILPLDFAKCLLVLGGDPRPGPDSKLVISRLVNNEIGSPRHKDGLVFARLSRRRATAEDQDEEPTLLRPDRPNAVQQFKFMRLSDKINYETLILALKGLQLALDPGDYITPEQLKTHPQLAGELDELFAWSAQPEPIKPKVVGNFCATIFEGLSKERHGKLAHSNTYVQWALDRIASQIAEFNKKLEN
ncbi:MAG: hypothetical protein GWP14_05280 [Actinobacteria bacterium]|nr:hypothetical protein [Actinomycetota bacterium]